MQDTLQEQTERVLDESESDRVDVIVRVEVDRERLQSLLQASAAATEKRRMCTRAGDALPPPADDLHRSKRKTFDVRGADAEVAPASMAAQAARRVPAPSKRAELQKFAKNALRPTLESKVVRQVRARDDGTITRLWSSGSLAVRASKDELRELLALPDVAGVVPNRVVHLPPVYEIRRATSADSPSDNGSSTWGLERTNTLGAWGSYGGFGAGVRVAVLDTGVDASHAELSGKVVNWAEWDRWGAELPKAPTSVDTRSHGTHVAATIAGGDASGRWIGVAPDAEILAGTVLPGGSGTDAQILAGLDWALDEGADVINLSLGGLSFEPDVNAVYTNAILSANLLGVPVVVAMGNEGHGTTGSPGNDYFAFTVGATDTRDRAAGFSSGRTQVVWSNPMIEPEHLPLVYQKPDVSAPGVEVTSAVPGGEYATWNGTSMATPHVSGAIALLLSNTDIADSIPDNTRAFVLQDLIRGSVRELGEAGQDQRHGNGRIDVLRAIGEAWRLGYA